MNHKIRQQERYLQDHKCVYRTICPRDQFTVAMLEERAQRDNMAVGDDIVVQFMGKGYTIGKVVGEVLAEGEFRIVERRDSLNMVEIDDRSTRQVEKREFRIVQVGDWVTFREEPVEEQLSVTSIRWNVGAGKYQLMSGGEVVFENEDKSLVEAYADKKEAA